MNRSGLMCQATLLRSQSLESWDWTVLADSFSKSGTYMRSTPTQSRTYRRSLHVGPGLTGGIRQEVQVCVGRLLM